MKNISNENIKLTIALCGLAIASVGLINNPIGVYFTPVSEALGLKRGTVAFYSTIFCITTAIFATLFVKKLNNQNFKKCLIVLSILTGLSIASFSLANNIITIYILSLLTGAFNAVFGMTNISVMIDSNYKENIGSMSSFIFLFCGVGGMIASPIYNYIIVNFGYKACYIINGILIILFCIPSYFTDISYESKLSNNKESHYSKKTLVIFTILNCIFCYISAVPQHFIGMALEKGYNSTLGSSILSMSMLGNIIIKLFIGKVCDTKGAKFAISCIEVGNIIASIIFIFMKNQYVLLTCGLIMGFNFAITSVCNLSFAKELFKDDLKDAFAIAALFATICQGFAVSLMGYIYDFTNSYIPVLIIAATLDLIALFITIYLNKKIV